jgi:hypothetical protein
MPTITVSSTGWTYTGNLQVVGTLDVVTPTNGANSIGGSPDPDTFLMIGTSFTGTGESGQDQMVQVGRGATLNVRTGNVAQTLHVSNTIRTAASGTHAHFTQLRVDDFAVQFPVGSTAVVTVASTVHVVGAATLGQTNYALFVDGSGMSRINGFLTFGDSSAATRGAIRADEASAFRLQAGTNGYQFRNNANDTTIATISNAGAAVVGTMQTAVVGASAGVWKLGTAAAVSPTSPDRTVAIDIGGTIYYLHAKTTND